MVKDVFGSMVKKIDFEWIDSVKLILAKSDLKESSDCIHSCKSKLNIKYEFKNQL